VKVTIVETRKDYPAFKVDDLGLRTLKSLYLLVGAYGEYPTAFDGDCFGCAEAGVYLDDLAVDKDEIGRARLID
jgi:hypothetical protein